MCKLRELKILKTVNITSLNMDDFVVIDTEDPYWTLAKEINVSNQNLTAIPVLEGELEVLDCSNNSLIYLPGLPRCLLILNCYNNLLRSIPRLPPRLEQLSCSNNQLRSLPLLPGNIDVLECEGNNLYLLPPCVDMEHDIDVVYDDHMILLLPPYIRGGISNERYRELYGQTTEDQYRAYVNDVKLIEALIEGRFRNFIDAGGDGTRAQMYVAEMLEKDILVHDPWI